METFFQEFNSFAILGLSRKPKHFSRGAYEFLKSQGYSLYPINPHAENIDGIKCYKNLADIPTEVQGAIFFTKPRTTRELLPVCKEKGINHVWLQLGASDKEVLKEAQKLQLNAINSCVYLHHPNSKFPHNIHRFFHQLFNKGKRS
ncbi:MAG: CoA-binding protein [Bacillota bacterium]